MNSSLRLWLQGPVRLLRLPLAAMLIFGVSANAESVYVTDMLRLDMYGTEAMTGPIILKLRSGDRLELLSNNGRYAFVRSDDGREGWVTSLYLVEDEPARTRVNKLEQDNASLETAVKKLRVQLAGEQARVAEIRQKHEGSAKLTAAHEQELATLREENAELTNRVSRIENSVPLVWFFLILAVTLVAGLAGGWYLVDSRSRAKHGGFRIY